MQSGVRLIYNSRIIIDNWTIERAVTSYFNALRGIGDLGHEFASFIEALILWENVEYVEKSESFLWQMLLEELNSPSCIQAIRTISNHEDKSPKPLENTLLQRADAYVELAQASHSDLLLSKERTEYLRSKRKYKEPERVKIIEKIDDKLNDYYEKIVSAPQLGGAFRYSALFDFVSQEAEATPKKILHTAFELRQDRDVRRFWEWCSDYNDSFEHGNYEHCKKLDEQLEAVLSAFPKATGEPFEIELNLCLFPPKISADIVKKTTKQVMHRSFSKLILIQRIMKNSIKRRPLTNYL